MKKILDAMRNLRNRVKGKDINDFDALLLVKENLTELAKEDKKNVELLAIQEEIENIKRLKDMSASFAKENLDLDNQYQAILNS